MKRKILIIAAHPDDEVLGCGGTVARLVKEGCEAYTLILGEGITSRDVKRNRKKRQREINELKKETYKANKIIGVKRVFTYNFPDNRFDSVSLLEIVKTIEKVKNKLKPDIIFTHYDKDLNIDHRIIYEAVITAIRPLFKETVREIYSFEVISSTEWNYPITFSPDVFFDISESLKYKLKAMGIYKSEIKEYPYPRSLKGIKLNAEYWGMKLGLKYIEAFKSIRVIR